MVKKFLLESLLATALVFGLMAAISVIPINLSALQPLENALHGFDLIDMYYSQLKSNDGGFSKEVVVVNIQDADRKEIAELIEFISFGSPSAVGVDVLFATPKNEYADSLLAYSLATNPNVVLGSFYNEEKNKIEKSASMFKGANAGFTNFVGTSSRYSTIRYFAPKFNADGRENLAFGVQLAKYAYPNQTKDFLERDNNREAINYLGDLNSFLAFEKDEILGLEIDPDVFTNKIVLIGYLGESLNDPNNIEDRLYTPLNPNINALGPPDMSGVIIHANIIDMIVNKRWINAMPSSVKWLLCAIGTYIHILLFMFLMIKWDLYFDAISRVLQIVSTILLVFLVFWCYQSFNFRIYIAPLLFAVALAVDALFIYEAVANTLNKRFKLKSILIQEP